MNRPSQPISAHPADVAVLRDEALAWFVRRNNEAFSAEDEEAFQAWICTDPAREAAMAHWQAEWQGFDAIPTEALQRLQSELAICKAQQSARQHPPPAPPTPFDIYERPKHPLPRRRALVPAVAGMVTMAVAAGAGLMAWNDWQAQPLYAQHFSTPQGQQADVTLPDGSHLRLDAATQLQVTFYRQHREVRLSDGQAVFSVQADATRPFRVNAGPLRVTVVGTRFMVRHTPQLPEGAGVQVAVEEGRVRVERADRSGTQPPANDAVPSGLSHQEAMVLDAGQQVISDAHGSLTSATRMPKATFALWRENRVRFDNTRLDQALAELARYRDPQLVVRDPAVAALRVTGVFDPRDPATFRRVLPMALPVMLKPGNHSMELVLAH